MTSTEWDEVRSGNALDVATNGNEGAQADGVVADRKARGSLARELERWQAEQERRFNRAWRRPGGLARPAGL